MNEHNDAIYVITLEELGSEEIEMSMKWSTERVRFLSSDFDTSASDTYVVLCKYILDVKNVHKLKQQQSSGHERMYISSLYWYPVWTYVN